MHSELHIKICTHTSLITIQLRHMVCTICGSGAKQMPTLCLDMRKPSQKDYHLFQEWVQLPAKLLSADWHEPKTCQLWKDTQDKYWPIKPFISFLVVRISGSCMLT